jgi:hypothetical protein
MLTREQIEGIRVTESQGAEMITMPAEMVTALATLALRALDTAADAALGAKLRDAVRGADIEIMERNAAYYRKRGNRWDARLQELGAEALRAEEGGRDA